MILTLLFGLTIIVFFCKYFLFQILILSIMYAEFRIIKYKYKNKEINLLSLNIASFN